MFTPRSNTMTYLRLKEGEMYLSTDKECENPLGTLTGNISKLELKQESYEGAPVEKLYVHVTNGSDTVNFQINTNSRHYSVFLGMLQNANVKEPIEFVPTADKQDNGKIRTVILVKQNGEWLKSIYTGNPLPRWKEVVLGKTTVLDKSEAEEILTEALTNLQSKLSGVKAPPAPLLQPKPEEDTSTENYLPF